MSETAVQEEICDICGVEVRDGSQFCYNCGGSVSAKPSKEGASNSTRTAAGSVIETEVFADPTIDEGQKVVLPGSKNGLSTLKGSARGERRPRKPVSRNKEIFWEPKVGVPWAYVIATAIILAIVLFLFLAAEYLR